MSDKDKNSGYKVVEGRNAKVPKNQKIKEKKKDTEQEKEKKEKENQVPLRGLVERENTTAIRNKYSKQMESIKREEYNKEQESIEARKQTTESRREKRRKEVEPQIQKYIREEEMIKPISGYTMFQQVQGRLSAPNTDIGDQTKSKGDLNTFPEIVILNIMRYLELFEDISFGATCKNLHQIYTNHRKAENYARIAYFYFSSIGDNHHILSNLKQLSKKILDNNNSSNSSSGNYLLLKNIAEMMVLQQNKNEGRGMAGLNSSQNPATMNILYTLAITPKKGYLKSLVQVLPYVDDESREYGALFRNCARYVIAGQPKFAIDELIGENMQNEILYELLACIVGELIVTNSFPPAGITNNVTKFYDIMVANKHPIATLPVRLLAIEVGANPGSANLRARGTYGFQPPREQEKNFPRPPRLPKDNKRNAFDPKREPFVVKDITTVEDMQGIMTAASYFWGAECRVLEVQNISRPLDARDIISVIVDGELNCVRGLNDERGDKVVVDEEYAHYYHCIYTSNNAYGLLFGASANGGTYSECNAGSYARIDAWKSLAALVGVPYSEGIEAIAKVAVNCIYLYFRGEGGTGQSFWGMAHNLGLGVLRTDRKTVAVLAFADGD